MSTGVEMMPISHHTDRELGLRKDSCKIERQPAAVIYPPLDRNTLAAVVDDEWHIRSVLRQLLERHDWRVVEAANGYDAVRLATDWPISLMFINLLMPQLGGIDAMLQIRSFNRELKFLVVTGIAYIADDVFAKVMDDLNVCHVFGKPFDVNEVMTILQECLLR